MEELKIRYSAEWWFHKKSHHSYFVIEKDSRTIAIILDAGDAAGSLGTGIPQAQVERFPRVFLRFLTALVVILQPLF